MKTSFEILSIEVIPSLRALIAKKLTTTHSLSQTEAGKRMGLSQPAISQYLKNLRGFKTSVFLTNKELSDELETFTIQIANGELSPEDQTQEIEKICERIVSLALLERFTGGESNV